MTETLQSLYGLFGKAVFLPLKLGTKKLKLPGWDKLTFADSQKTDYQKKLQTRLAAGGNLACRCGPLSDDLFSIDIDDDGRLSEFLGLNSWSTDTAITKGKKGGNVWLRSASPNYPNGQSYYRLLTNSGQAYGEFRCGGGGGAYTVIFGRHPEGVDYQIFQRKPACVLDVSQINWPADVVLPWLSQSAGPAAASSPKAPHIFPSHKQRPCFRCYDTPIIIGHDVYPEGVYYHFVKEEKDAAGNVVQLLVDLWICSILRVLCIIRSATGTGHAYLIEYIPHGETTPRRAVLSQAALLGRGEEAMKELRDLGITVLGHNVKYIREYLDLEHLRFSSQKTPDDFWTSVKVIGWAPVGERFVLPHDIIGNQRGVWFSGKTDIAQYKKHGDFADWQTRVAKPCENNPYLILALSCAFAGPILEPLNVPGLGIHYFGDSTTGKSTSLLVGASAWGSEKFAISWRTTINGLESQAVCRCSTLMPVDESHQVDPRILDASVYMLLNGAAKGRMNKDTSPREIEHWRICVLSSGERSIETHQTTAKIDHKVGQTVRMIDVPVVNGTYGLFSDIHGAKNGAEFADALRDAAAKHYGHAGPEFLSGLIQRYPSLHWRVLLETMQTPFGDALSAQDARVARSFALVALAGELAIRWNILPWAKGSALTAAIEIFNHWKATQPESLTNKEAAQILSIIADAINRFSESRFSDLNWTPVIGPSGHVVNEEPMIRDRLGYWDDSTGNRFYLFTSGGLKEVTNGYDFNRVLRVLQDAEAFVKTGAGKTSIATRIPDGRAIRLYWLNPAKL